MIERLGYFCPSNGLIIGEHMTPGLQRNLGLSDTELADMPSLSGGVHGFEKAGRAKALVEEAMALALVEENLKAMAPRQFHEQTLLSVLLHRHFSPVVWPDRLMYGVDQGDILSAQQRLWCHRRAIQPSDMEYFRQYIGQPGPPRLPSVPPKPAPPSLLRRLRIRIAKWRGRYPGRDPGTYVYDGVKD